MQKFLGLTTQLSEKTGMIATGECFFSVKKCIVSAELWVDEDFEMIAAEVKGRESKCIWEIAGTYKARTRTRER
jgi:hypothetical protein